MENPFYNVVTKNLLVAPMDKNAMTVIDDFNTQHLRIAPTVCAEDRFSLDDITNNMINLYKMQRVNYTFLSNIKRLYLHNREISETAKICTSIEKSRLYTIIYSSDKKLIVYDNASRKKSLGMLKDASEYFAVHRNDTSPFVANVLLNNGRRVIAIIKWKGTVETQKHIVDALYDRCYRVSTWRSMTASTLENDCGGTDFICCHPAIGCWIVPVHFSPIYSLNL